MLPLLLAERRAFLDTVRGLTPDEFEHGATLCDAWSPRDVLGHVIGVDRELGQLLRTGPVTSRFNARVVDRARTLSREQLLNRGEQWATEPPSWVRALAWFLVGDVSVHHQDVVRGLGQYRIVPPRVAAAILREGMVLGPHRLMRHRLVPTDGHRAVGLPGAPTVQGPAEALGMWLAGRGSVASELDFARS